MFQNNKLSRLGLLKSFYSILNYCYKSTVDKVFFDRVGKSIFKWWLINIPDLFPGCVFRILRFLRRAVELRHESKFRLPNKKRMSAAQYSSNLSMNPIPSSVRAITVKKIKQS